MLGTVRNDDFKTLLLQGRAGNGQRYTVYKVQADKPVGNRRRDGKVVGNCWMKKHQTATGRHDPGTQRQITRLETEDWRVYQESGKESRSEAARQAGRLDNLHER